MFSVINIGTSFGVVLATMNLIPPSPNPPVKLSSNMLNTSSKKGDSDIVLCLDLVPPGTIISPFKTALPNKVLLNILGSAFIITPFWAGAIVTDLASLTSIFLIAINSPMLVLAFLLIIPSILITCWPTSVG